MLYVMYGPDDYSIHKSLEEIKKRHVGDASGETGAVVLDGSRVSPADFEVACATLPFLAENRLVVAKDLLARFENRQKPRQGKKKSPRQTKSVELQFFAGCINSMPESTILILVDGVVSRSNPLLKNISGKGEIREFPLLKRKELIPWIQKQVKKSGGEISPRALESLARLVGNDLWIMSNEIDKLVYYASGRVIQENDVRAVVSYAQEANVFVLIDAIFEGKVGLAQGLLQQLLQKGAVPVYLLTMLSRQIRLAVLAREYIAQKKSKAEIQSKMGLADYPLQKTLEQAARYSWENMKRFYEKLLETDVAIKTGKYSDELALNILIVELCQR